MLSDYINFAKLQNASQIIVHGDSVIAHPYLDKTTINDTDRAVSAFIDDFLSQISEDTKVFVPAFTYDFTKTGLYDQNCSPPETGLFSRVFWRNFSKFRTLDPIFSHSSNKPLAEQAKTKTYDAAFGTNSFYDELCASASDTMIVNLGCSFERTTIVHNFEEQQKVKYRYNKFFNGVIRHSQKDEFVRYRFFCRNLTDERPYSFKSIYRMMNELKTLERNEFFRINVNIFSLSDLKVAAEYILLSDKEALRKL